MATSTVPTFTKSGAKAAAAAKLDKAVFAVMPENHELLKLAYSAYLANGRENLAQTKTRGLVSGGGKKPWKQKGTGRARFGSSRNPIWRGGGIAFGPTGGENYTIKINVSTKRLALRQALSMAAAEGRITVIETVECKDGKVATFSKTLSKIEAKGRTLVVCDQKDDMVERATRNLQEIKVVQANYLNVYDIINADTIVLCEKSLTVINEWLGGTK
ncbi:MAG TPA: 50S ribosomal protein L4 [Patescibacteria group bacterium]|nr:50S ribosomal protein L4 [Patescibacteria group bacterium]